MDYDNLKDKIEEIVKLYFQGYSLEKCIEMTNGEKVIKQFLRNRAYKEIIR